MARKILVVVLLMSAIVITVAMIVVRNQPYDKKYACDQAIALMEKGDFIKAGIALEKIIHVDNRYARAHYALAVTCLRLNPPQLDKAMEQKIKARQLGYVIPEWFDNYYRILASKPEK